MDIAHFDELFLLGSGGELLHRRTGRRAGHLQADGYRRVVIGGKKHYEHRVVFAMSRGHLPVGQVDHVNGVRDDNRPANLRDATHAENQHNSRLSVKNRSGVKGVSWESAHKKWRACLSKNNRTVTVGRFDTLADAERAIAAARAQMHGEFANSGVARPVLG